ncbi:hypothetical protein HMI55_007031 [Coelomomyces lativittatus]|nr:hypothetical protein HMI56_001286 [Coelomomyces lativittatus]KAJ1517453.1 hypothetical protein HMI55_007031 [Coelomomyces lativittatus]
MLPQDDPNSLTTESEEENDYQKENAILRENIAIVKRSIIENNNIIRLYNKSKEDNLRLSNKLESTKDELNNQLKEIKVLKSNELEVQGLQSQLKNISSSNAYLKSKLEEKSKIIEELQSKLRTMDTNPINHHTSNFEAIQKLEPSTQFNATNNDPSFLESFSNSMRYLDGPPSSSRTSSITLAKLLKEIPSPMGKFSNNESNSTNKGVEGNPSTPCASTRFPSPNSPGPVDRMHLLHSTSVVPSKINQATSHSTAVHLLPENVETLLSNALLHQTSHFLTQKRRLLAFQMFERWKLKVAQTKLVRLKNFVKQLEKQLAESEKKNSIQDKELDFFAQSGPLVNPPSQKSPEDQSELAHVKEENKLLSSKIKDIEEEQILLLKMITRLKSEKIQPKNTVSIGVSTTSAIMMDSGCQTNLEQVSKVSNNMIFDSTPASFGSPSASTPLNLDSPPSETSQNIVSITSKRNHTDSSPLNVPTESKKRSRRFIVDDEDFLIKFQG